MLRNSSGRQTGCIVRDLLSYVLSHNYFNFLSIHFVGFFFGAATCEVDVLKVNEVVCERKVEL